MIIPKKIHYCWFGRGEKPDDVHEILNKWKDLHPDFDIVEWNEDNFDLDLYPYTREAYDNQRYAFVTDVVRLYALYTQGGIYMDTDVEVLKPLDDFLQFKAFTGCETEKMCVTGTMGSVANGKWVKELLDYYKDLHFLTTKGVNLTTNTTTITDITKRSFGWKEADIVQDLGDVIIFSSDFFCAKSYRTGNITMTENTHTIHHFKGSWKTETEKKKSQRLNLIKSKLIDLFGEEFFNKVNKTLRKRR